MTLLNRLRHTDDEAAWNRFVELYTPLLYKWARRCGESEHDAADLVQEVFVSLLSALPSFTYDPRSRFHAWLRTLLMNKLRDRKRRAVRAGKALAQLPAEEMPDAASCLSETEYQTELARRALELMQEEFAPTTWKACWETVVHGRDASEVAGELGLSINAVYIAKYRVLRRLREELGGLMD